MFIIQRETENLLPASPPSQLDKNPLDQLQQGPPETSVSGIEADFCPLDHALTVDQKPRLNVMIHTSDTTEEAVVI